MILIVASGEKDRALFTALCDQRGWPCQSCGSLADFRHSCERSDPTVVLARHRLSDGYSDDLHLVLKQHFSRPPQTIVLMGADTTSRAEARQITLGADCVLRDPLRVEVLLEYLAKFRAPSGPGPATMVRTPSFFFAGAEVFSLEHRVVHNGVNMHLSPQETNFLRLMARTPGKVVTYPVLYAELFGRRFVGETSNCRVLLGKSAGTLKKLGIDLRAFVTVIPKSGYRYEERAAVPQAPAPEDQPPPVNRAKRARSRPPAA